MPAEIIFRPTPLQNHDKPRVSVVTAAFKLGVLASLLVPVDLPAVKHICQDSNPGVAQQAQNHRVALVVQRAFLLGVYER